MTRSRKMPGQEGDDLQPVETSWPQDYLLPPPPGGQTRFVRYECKYLVTPVQVERIRSLIRPFVRYDPYAQKSPDHQYMITSLYLDSLNLRLFRETQDGVLNRIKLRIRSYDEVPENPVFLEIKRRNNGVVNKSRARLSRPAVEAMLRGSRVETGVLPNDERACYEEFRGCVSRWGAMPMVWVRYQREAYVGSLDTSLRITLDRNLACSPTHDESMTYAHLPWWPVENRALILELKFNRSFPSWLENLVRCMSLRRISFSKYGNSVTRGLGHWMRIPG